MKKRIHMLFSMVVVCLLSGYSLFGQEEALSFPGDAWQNFDRNQPSPWDFDKLDEVKNRYLSKTYWDGGDDESNLMVIYKGQVVLTAGDVAERNQVNSVRKSFYSALYGTYVASGAISLDETVESLNIQEKPPFLSPVQRTATIGDLLRSRSGVAHCAAYSPSSIANLIPPVFRYPPDQFWFYNNWDFNTSAVVIEEKLHRTFYDLLLKDIAKPIGMEDYCDQTNVDYPEWPVCTNSTHVSWKECSIMPAYTLEMSTRDMARFGLLFLADGRWGDQQVIPESWVDITTCTHTVAADTDGPSQDPGDMCASPAPSKNLAALTKQINMDKWIGGYGMLWWTVSKEMAPTYGPNMYCALGSNNNSILVLPDHDLVVAMQLKTSPAEDTFEVMDHILEALNPTAE